MEAFCWREAERIGWICSEVKRSLVEAIEGNAAWRLMGKWFKIESEIYKLFHNARTASMSLCVLGILFRRNEF
jgi:hypothetical protein